MVIVDSVWIPALRSHTLKMVVNRDFSAFDDSITEALRLGDLAYFEKLLRTISHNDSATVTSSPLNLNVNVFDAEGWTMLHRCCINGKLELLKILVELGADVRLTSRDGWNALHLATYNDWEKITATNGALFAYTSERTEITLTIRSHPIFAGDSLSLQTLDAPLFLSHTDTI